MDLHFNTQPIYCSSRVGTGRALNPPCPYLNVSRWEVISFYGNSPCYRIRGRAFSPLKARVSAMSSTCPTHICAPHHNYFIYCALQWVWITYRRLATPGHTGTAECVHECLRLLWDRRCDMMVYLSSSVCDNVGLQLQVRITQRKKTNSRISK